MKIIHSLLNEFDRRNGLWKSGLFGSAVIMICSIVTALFYRGRLGEPYTPLNHFVSELGELGVSPLAWLFNLGLFGGGLVLVIFLIGLGRRIGGWLGRIFGLIGFATGICGALVGAFPMNNLGPHIFFAMNFFNLGLVCMLFFTFVILSGRQRLPRRMAVPGLLAAAAFGAFLYWPLPNRVGAQTTLASVGAMLSASRQPVWSLAVFEWLVILAVLGWAASVAWTLRKLDANDSQ